MIATEDLQQITDHTNTVWEELKGKTIFLTGGTGFFGKWLLESFLFANDSLSLDAKMIVLSRDPVSFLSGHPFFNRSSITFVSGDVRTFTFPAEEIDYIIHAATEASVSLNLEQPLLMYDTIVDGTRRVLDLAHSKKVKAVLHTSSGAIYGRQPSSITHVPEDFSGSPDVYDKGAAYGEGKRVAELLANQYYNIYGVASKIARCYAFAGPYLPLDTHFAIGNFINDVLHNREIVINGDGSPYRSYLYASDLTIWLWQILVFGKPARPYNVGSDEDVTIEQLANEVSFFAGGNSEVQILQPKSKNPPARYVPDIKRAKDELNLSVLVPLHEAIRKTIKYYSK